MTTQEEIISPPIVTLSDCIDKYMAIRGIEKRKNYPKFLIIGQKVWQEIFQKTIWVTQSVWKELKKGEPYNYIDMPSGCARLFSVNTVDDCGNQVPLYFNSKLNVIPKPTVKKCGCGKCDCSGLCEDLNSTTLTTKEVFTINGITYYEKTWIKYCPNGDIIEYREVPTKKYNDFVGSGGDFNDDFNDDFSIGNPGLENFDIVTQTFQTKICSLTVRPCGCPENTEENVCKVTDLCSNWLTCFAHVKRCNRFLDVVNSNCQGEISISECGTRIYFKPSQSRYGKQRPLPDFLLVNFQSNGKVVGQEAQIPEYAENCMFTGIDWYSKRFNNMYNISEKLQAKYEYRDEQNQLIQYLNPLSMQTLSDLMDVDIKW